MYGSPPASKDLNLAYPTPSAPFGGHREDESQSDLLRRHRQQQQQQQQQQQMSSGLLRFRSAPSSLLGEACEDFLPVRPSSPETETMFDRFLGTDLRNEMRPEKPPLAAAPAGGAGKRNSHFAQQQPPPVTSAEEVNTQHMLYHSQQQQHMPNQYQVVGSVAMDDDQIKNNGGGSGVNSPNLVRQSSSPAGLFSHFSEENGYGVMRVIGGFRNGNNSIGEASNRMKGQISFSSRQSSLMSQISEVASEGIEGGSPEESSGGGRCYIPGFPVTSWEQTSLISDNNVAGLKRGRDGEAKMMMGGLSTAMLQNGEMRNHVPGLAHQFSLPKTSSEMAAIDKFLQFNDTVPFKVRAKRGCATHPRSIAERVRRTRISERIRKLQELVPNMDKQTNTADMLDLAVDYINDLQRQVKALNESRRSCTCSATKQNQYSNP